MSAVVVPDILQLETRASQQPIYDRPVQLALLHRDSRRGAEHYLVRYPAGLRARPHTHTAAHTVVVIDGHLLANGEELGPGGYVHFPAGEVMHHEASREVGCAFITIFDGPFDVSVR